jgi:uncharacterized protein YcaQ
MLPGAENLADARPVEPTLIGPFDNLLWDRGRVRRVFGFDYIFEAYKPKDKRVYGYYVLGLLDDFQFIGRVDLRREDSHLTVLGAHAESATEANRFEVSLDKTLERLTRQITK